jgi:PAS domain S-box-containing protein
VEAAATALAMFDTQMRYLAVSKGWLDFYGLDGAELIGRSHYEVFPEIPYRWKLAHRAGLAGQRFYARKDYFLRGDGEPTWLSWELQPWRASDGRIGGVLLLTEPVAPGLAAGEP